MVSESELFGVADLVFSIYNESPSSLVSAVHAVLVGHLHFGAIGIDFVLVVFVALFVHKCCFERGMTVLQEVSRHLELEVLQVCWWFAVSDCVSACPHSDPKVQGW